MLFKTNLVPRSFQCKKPDLGTRLVQNLLQRISTNQSKTAVLLTNGIPVARFPALGTSCMSFLRVLIGWLRAFAVIGPMLSLWHYSLDSREWWHGKIPISFLKVRFISEIVHAFNVLLNSSKYVGIKAAYLLIIIQWRTLFATISMMNTDNQQIKNPKTTANMIRGILSSHARHKFVVGNSWFAVTLALRCRTLMKILM